MNIEQAIRLKRAARTLFLATALFLAPAPFLTYEYVYNGNKMARDLSVLKPDKKEQYAILEQEEQKIWDEIVTAIKNHDYSLNGKSIELETNLFKKYEINRQERKAIYETAPFTNNLYSIYHNLGVVI